MASVSASADASHAHRSMLLQFPELLTRKTDALLTRQPLVILPVVLSQVDVAAPFKLFD